jgi:hypothetical protein
MIAVSPVCSSDNLNKRIPPVFFPLNVQTYGSHDKKTIPTYGENDAGNGNTYQEKERKNACSPP